MSIVSDLVKGAGDFLDYIPVIGPILHKGGDVLSSVLDSQETARQQQTTYDREDTAAQRRAADLKAAGMSPILAAGSAAQTSQPITTQMQIAGQKAAIAQAQALTEKTKAETQGIILQNNANSQPAWWVNYDKEGNASDPVSGTAAQARVAMELNEKGFKGTKAKYEAEAERFGVTIKDVEAYMAKAKKNVMFTDTADGKAYNQAELEVIALGLAVNSARQQQAIAGPLVEMAQKKGLNLLQIEMLLKGLGVLGSAAGSIGKFLK